MLTGWHTRKTLARAFGLPEEAVIIAVSRLDGRKQTNGLVYEANAAARAAVEYCEARARDAQVRLENLKGHGGAYTRQREVMWRERALRLRREYLRGEQG